MPPSAQKLSFLEKAGYSAADAAANFVFMTMILFQTNFYTDVFGLTAAAACRHPFVAAPLGRRRRSHCRHPGRSHRYALGQIPSLGPFHRRPLVHRHDPRLHHSQGLEHA